MATVELRNVSKTFGTGKGIVKAVDSIDLTIPDGSFVVLLGPTGAGKTTTLRLIAGLEEADDGDIAIAGESVISATPAQRNVAMVFQQYSLYPHLSVKDNLAFPLKSPILQMAKADINKRIDEVANVLQITDKLNNKATELSGGEMQRVSIGRALVRSPSIFLMDEPLSSLDAKLRSELRLELKHLQSDLGATFLYVTHDQIEAMTMATHVGVLDEGKLVQFGSPREIYENPVSLYVASRLGLPRINVVPVEAIPADVIASGVKGAVTQSMITIGLRPENIVVNPPSDVPGFDALVERIEPLGDQTRLHLSIKDHVLVTLVESHNRLEVGENVRVSLRNPLFFNAEGERVN